MSISLTIITFVTVKIWLYENPYNKAISKIQIVDNKIKIKDFSVRVYPTDGKEILIKAEQYYTDINDLNKHSFIKVQTTFK